VENKTDIMKHNLKIQYISLLPKHIILIFGVFLCMFTYVNIGRLKDNVEGMLSNTAGIFYISTHLSFAVTLNTSNVL
jgi:uncharacterized membrane protein